MPDTTAKVECPLFSQLHKILLLTSLLDLSSVGPRSACLALSGGPREARVGVAVVDHGGARGRPGRRAPERGGAGSRTQYDTRIPNSTRRRRHTGEASERG